MTEAEKQKEASWYNKFTSFFGSSNQPYEINEFENGSKAIYLMAPDNKFLNFILNLKINVSNGKQQNV